ncbi:phBC6A51 family helix-turn-helix protein [Bacillus sp. NPDC077027]|uniref:phBC6A51 family helix-turn-helix protein n=1 Tax=Bacillus sp. NPDC077027 TaxID=3390548 RepID=UPI003D082B62
MSEQKQIPVPSGITEEQARLAKLYVMERHQSGISVGDFCSKHGISTATWYGESYMKNQVFESYLTALGGTVVSADEQEAYQIVKQKIMQMATKQSAGVKEIQLFLENFSHVVEADKQSRMKELGIVPEHEKGQFKTVEERKASLLARLKG